MYKSVCDLANGTKVTLRRLMAASGELRSQGGKPLAAGVRPPAELVHMRSMFRESSDFTLKLCSLAE